jgi:hypothetical protein
MTSSRSFLGAAAVLLFATPLACGAASSAPAVPTTSAAGDAGSPSDLTAFPPAAGSGTTGNAGARTASPGIAGTGLHVVGNHFVDGGKIVRLLGVNVSGTENYCEQGIGIFQAPSDASLVGPMRAWKINTVRVPLNEDCWLGINGVKPQYGGTAYQQAIAAHVKVLREGGMYVVLDLHLNAPGATLATSQQPMADADHSVAFWQSVAQAFKTQDGVIFDLYNEPNVDGGSVTAQSWDCWLNGCANSSWTGFSGSAQTAGMQQMLNAIRAAGASNVILATGLGSGEFLGDAWLAHKPRDPLNNVAAGHHNYSFNGGCNTPACWQSTVANVAAVVPVVVGELGENDCAHGYVDTFFAWADPLGLSYLGWTWNPWDCASGPALITDYSGAPTGFGQGFKAHLATQ